MNLMCLATIVFCSLLMLLCFIGSIVRITKNKKFDLVDWLIISLGAYNGIGIVFILIEVQSPKYKKSFKAIISNESVVWAYPLYSLIAVFFIWVGASLAKNSTISLDSPEFYSDKSYLFHSNAALRTALIFLFFGFILYWIYVLPYGGFISYLDYSLAVRAALFDEVNVDRSLSFLKRFGGFIFFSTLLISGLILTYKTHQRNRIHLWLLFIISLGLSIYVLYSWGGRLELLIFITSLLVGHFLFKNGYGFKFSIKMIIPVLVILCALPLSSKIWGKNKGGSEVAGFFVNEISYPLFVFDKAYKSNDYRWMQDLVLSPAYILPERIWSGVFGMDTVSQISTERVVGIRKGVNRSTKGVPVDFISFGIMEGGVFGVILVSIFFGYFLKKINNLLFWQCWPGYREMLYGYAIFSLPVELVLYSDPKHIVIRNFHFIAGIFTLYFFNRKRKYFISKTGGYHD